LKPEQWGSPLVQEKYQEEKACDKRHPFLLCTFCFKNVYILTALASCKITPLSSTVDADPGGRAI